MAGRRGGDHVRPRPAGPSVQKARVGDGECDEVHRCRDSGADSRRRRRSLLLHAGRCTNGGKGGPSLFSRNLWRPVDYKDFFLAHAGGWSAAGPSALPVSISNSNDELGAGLNFESCSNSDKRIDLLLRILLFVWYGSIYFFLPKKDKRITILIFLLLIYNVVILLEDDMKCIPLHEMT